MNNNTNLQIFDELIDHYSSLQFNKTLQPHQFFIQNTSYEYQISTSFQKNIILQDEQLIFKLSKKYQNTTTLNLEQFSPAEKQFILESLNNNTKHSLILKFYSSIAQAIPAIPIFSEILYYNIKLCSLLKKINTQIIPEDKIYIKYHQLLSQITFSLNLAHREQQFINLILTNSNTTIHINNLPFSVHTQFKLFNTFVENIISIPVRRVIYYLTKVAQIVAQNYLVLSPQKIIDDQLNNDNDPILYQLKLFQHVKFGNKLTIPIQILNEEKTLISINKQIIINQVESFQKFSKYFLEPKTLTNIQRQQWLQNVEKIYNELSSL